MPRETAAQKAAESAAADDTQAGTPEPNETQTPDKPAEKPPMEEVKEPTIEEYEQHRLDVLSRLPEEEARPKNIYARLAQINGLIGLIRKTGTNTFHRYRYAKESDLVEEIRPILSSYGIWIEQGLYADPEQGYIAHQRLGQTKKDRDGNVIGEQETLTAITKRFRFVWWNAASKVLEYTEWEPFMGYGDDSGDKGYYKAETGAVKYFLMKTFMVATGDDPEGDPGTDRRADARDRAGATQVRVQGGNRGPQPTAGGRQQDPSRPQIKQVGDLLKANAAGQAIKAIPLIEELTGAKVEVDPDDIPGSLSKWLQQMKPNEIGKLIYDLRKRAEGLSQSDAAPVTGNATEGPGEQDQAHDAAADSDGAVADDADDGSIDEAVS